MSNDLSPEQAARRKELWEQALATATCTEPADRPRAEAALREGYRLSGLAEVPIVWAESPRHAQSIIRELKRRENAHAWSLEGLPTAEEAAADPVPQESWESTNHWGSVDSFWTRCADYCREWLGVKFSEEETAAIRVQDDIAASMGVFYPFERVCVACERPSVMHVGNAGEFLKHHHGDLKPGFRYRDGYQKFKLHGVEVPEWLAMTPEGQIDPARIAEIQNVEVRREFVRRVGIERICSALKARVLDRETFTNDTGEHPYELLELNLGKGEDGRKRVWRYLRMENPSVPGVYHVEGVPNDVKTVREALLFRAGLKEEQIDDENGADWNAQGDVLMFPKGATKFRRFPRILT